MEIPPPHVLAQLDAIIVGQSSAANEGARATSSVEVLEEDDDQSVTSAAFGIESSATSFSEPVEDESGGAPTASSRFWGVYWDRRDKKWRAGYKDADGKNCHIGYFDNEERVRNSPGQGRRRDKRRREEPAAATPSTRARRPRRAINYDDFELDDDDEGLQLEPDDDDGWD